MSNEFIDNDIFNPLAFDINYINENAEINDNYFSRPLNEYFVDNSMKKSSNDMNICGKNLNTPNNKNFNNGGFENNANVNTNNENNANTNTKSTSEPISDYCFKNKELLFIIFILLVICIMQYININTLTGYIYNLFVKNKP